MRTPLLLALLLCAPAALAQDWQLPPTYGSVELNEGFLPDPHEVSLTAGGCVPYDPECYPYPEGSVPAVSGCDFGHIAEAPDYDLYYGTPSGDGEDRTYSTGGTNTLYIYVTSGSDTTLLVNTPSRTWACDDDSFGDGDPLVVIQAASGGLYDIWVGTFGEDPAEATLYISEVDPRGE